MTGIQTNFTAADMLGGTKAAPVKKSVFKATPKPAPKPEPVVEVEEVVEDVVEVEDAE